jgi:ABC-type multidrug transport system fused ATPase/permease subunit
MKYTSLLRVITPPAGTLGLIVALLLAGSAVALLQPWLAGKVTGHILDPALSGLGLLLLAWLGLGAVSALLSLSSGYLVGATGEDMSATLRTRVYEHLQTLPMSYFHQRKQGETLSLLTRDADVISQFITQTLVQVLPHVVTFAGAFALMALLDPMIAGLALVLMPLYYLAMKLIGRRIRPIASEWVQSWSRMYAFAEENLGLLPAIKAFTREPVESARFADRNRELRTLSKRQIQVQSALAAAVSFLATAGLLALVWIGARHVQAGQLAAPELVSLLLYAMLMTRPVSGLASVYGQVQRTRGAAERLLACFTEQPEPDSAGARALAQVRGDIRFEGVSFAYPGRPAAVNEVNLDIAAGETVGIVGPNGAGKSTLAWLLMRFADPSAGHIRVDGTDLRTVSLASLRAHIGLVPQHTLLLNASVRDNIAYGFPAAGEDAVRAAAAAARADEFIAQLPDGYDTLIGDQGVRLSGGQRQRLSLARTLLKDPPIIILDEATSMFDPQGEKDFLAECAELLAGRTVIMITHRPMSLSIADRVIEMRDGRLLGEHPAPP